MVFEPFFTTRVARKGIGLGLSISKKTMEDHGGFITVESKPGEGAVFRLYFPYSDKT
jgi:two-component system cell cycle sensor histidine kinase/response regulator CckA